MKLSFTELNMFLLFCGTNFFSYLEKSSGDKTLWRSWSALTSSSEGGEGGVSGAGGTSNPCTRRSSRRHNLWPTCCGRHIPCSRWRFSTKCPTATSIFTFPFPLEETGKSSLPHHTSSTLYALASTEARNTVNTSTAQAHLHDFLL